MPNYLMVTSAPNGLAQAKNLTRYYFPIGRLFAHATEANQQLVARDSYTLSGLYVYVSANAKANATTVNSRKENPPNPVGDGNMTISIAGGATGAFTEAAPSSDSLIDGDLFDTKIVTADEASALAVTFTVVSYVLSTISNTTPILAITGGIAQPANLVRYYIIAGYVISTDTEAFAYYTFRVAATLANLRCYISANTVTATSTLRTKNGANYYNQSVSITASTTGAFEDTVNTDSVTSGGDVHYELTTGVTGTSLSITSIQMKSNSIGKQVISSYVVGTVISQNTARFVAVGGTLYLWNADETLVQATARCAFTAKNMYANVSANAITTISTITLRKDTANSALTVSVPASTTGQFEDTDPAHAVSFIATSLIDWGVVAGTGAGGTTITIICIGFELAQPSGVTSVSDELQAIWNNRAKVSDTSQLVYNVRALASQTSQLIFNVRAIIADTLGAIWNVRAITSDILQFIWGVRAPANQTSQLIWDTRKTVSDTFQAIWNVLAITTVSNAVELVWNVKVAVSDTLQSIWGVRTLASNTVELVYGIRAFISSTIQSLWKVKGLASKTKQVIWNVKRLTPRCEILTMIKRVREQDVIERTECPDCIYPLDKMEDGTLNCMFCRWTTKLDLLWRSRLSD